MKGRLTEGQMESLCEAISEEATRTGISVRELAERLCAREEMRGVVSCGELVRTVGAFRRKERRRQEYGREISTEPAMLGGVADDRISGSEASEPQAAAGTALELLRYLGGNLIRGKVVWKTAKSYTLRPGECAEYRREPGDGWLVCAVVILRAGVVVKVFPEMRPKRRRPAGWRGTRGETLIMQRLTIDCEELDREKIITRYAAAMQLYCRDSGLRNAAHVARLTGRTRAAGAAQRANLVRDYYQRTDGEAGFAGVSSSRRLKERAKSRAGQASQAQPTNRKKDNAS